MLRSRLALLMVLLFSISLVSVIAAPPDLEAVAITWKNSKGYWFAVGPVQSLQVGCNTEEEALRLVTSRGDTYFAGDPDNVSQDYKYRVYYLGRPFKSYDLDVYVYAESRLSFYVTRR